MYGLVTEGEPFRVFARRESTGANALVIRFECKEGMGVLGLRKSGRSDPAPSAAYEEEEIDPASLRAGRFVHVLPSGQRQSYALSRISADVAGRLPTDRWVELKPHTEYGFRYLVAPDAELDGTKAAVQIAGAAGAGRADAAREPTIPIHREPPQPHGVASAGSVAPQPHAMAPAPMASTPMAAPLAAGLREVSLPIREATGPLPPVAPSGPISVPIPPAPAVISDAAMRVMSKDQVIDALRAEIHKVHVLQQRVVDLEEGVRRSRARERDLIELLAKWESR
ncbi:MAG: hypothetical protein ABMB14_27135 [Myxococcota bacterium]